LLLQWFFSSQRRARIWILTAAAVGINNMMMIGTLLFYLVSKLNLSLFTMIGDRLMVMEEHRGGRDNSSIHNNGDDDDINDDIIDDFDDIIDDAAAVAIEYLQLLPPLVRLLDSIIVEELAPPNMLPL
jgi:hypothetical protein